MDAPTHEDISRALTAALETARRTQPEIGWSLGMTSGEVAEHLGVSQKTARAMLRRAIQEGTVECPPQRAVRRNMAHGVSKVPV